MHLTKTAGLAAVEIKIGGGDGGGGRFLPELPSNLQEFVADLRLKPLKRLSILAKGLPPPTLPIGHQSSVANHQSNTKASICSLLSEDKPSGKMNKAPFKACPVLKTFYFCLAEG